MRYLIASALLFALLLPDCAGAFPFKRKKSNQPAQARWGMTKEQREKAIRKGLRKNRGQGRSKAKPVEVRAKVSPH